MEAYRSPEYRLDELIDAYASVYHSPQTDVDMLRITKRIVSTNTPGDASWLIARTDDPSYASYVSAFSRYDTVADFALIGPPPSDLPDDLIVTAVEQYANGDYLTLGKRVP